MARLAVLEEALSLVAAAAVRVAVNQLLLRISMARLAAHRVTYLALLAELMRERLMELPA